MARIVFVTLLLFSLSAYACAQEDGAQGIVFDTVVHDFGILAKGSDASYDFRFVNRNDSPQVINNVKSSCNCTVTSWTREPVMPGESGNVTVAYNTRITGTFQKTIQVQTSQNPQPIVLTIKGTVEKVRKKR